MNCANDSAQICIFILYNMTIGLFIFTRDLRIQDNIGLRVACSQCDRLYTCFVNQTSPSNKNATMFMLDCIDELAYDIDSVGGELFQINITNLASLSKRLTIDHVFFNNNLDLVSACKKYGLEYTATNDMCLYEPGTVLSGGGTIYKKFTPFYTQVLPKDVPSPVYTKKFDMLDKNLGRRHTSSKGGGRTLGIKALKKSLNSQKDYGKHRDQLTYETSRLSAHINFGTVSIREIYHAFKKQFGIRSELIRQLIWHDFYAHVLHGYPESFTRKGDIKWPGSRKHFEMWCKGETGVPVVDACMRELNETGYMHNRGRMIVASFLVKTLLVDWRLGEQYFAKQLVDYDLASNNGNWQWIAGTGVDSMPYFRIMNPWTQSKKSDPNAEYIKKWMPELANVDPRDLHDPARMDPIVDFREQSKKYLALY